ncbi:MAG: hypothetical protein ISR99_03180 [Parcubacteria group bacterium]|nr:hypothetical protein [Parcubacteria group bacterium]
MDENIKTKIQEHFEKLPQTLKEAIHSSNFQDKLLAISKKHRLHINQGATLENETLLVMMGLDDASSFTKNLQNELEISKEQAEQITADVAKEILLPIRESLKELLERQSQEEAESEKEAVPPTESTPAVNESAPIPIPTPKEETLEDPKSDLSAKKLNETTQRSTPVVNIKEKEGEKKFSDDPYRETIE